MRLIIFDFDGTLMDTQSFIKASMRRGYERAGLEPPSDDATLSIVGLSLPEAISKLSPELPPDMVAKLVGNYKECFVEIRAETGGEASLPLFPGALEVLERLYQEPETLLGIATGKARRGLDHAFEAHKLEHFFTTIQTADLHPSKPHPSMVHACLQETGVEEARTALIGDSEYDIRMAKSAGVRAVGVNWGYHSTERLLAAGADAILDHFDSLEDAMPC